MSIEPSRERDPSTAAAASELAPGKLVWDLPVRLIHWSLLLCVVAAWLTREIEGDWFVWHTRFGYAVLLLVVTRLLWGFVGTRHARFASFVRGPASILRYLRGDSTSSPNVAVGHNPLGALMVLALLGLLLIQALTGLFANDQIMETGPLFGYVSSTTSDALTTVHKQVFDLIVAAVFVHVAAALFYLWVRHDNLILPMLTGRKSADRVPAGEEIRSSRTAVAVAILIALGAVLYWVISTAPEPMLFSY
ncbi:MAG: cytochrome b [Sinobacteraceae bacterium]|nr:cytochrome b [Nevskiaceae bacterium]